MNKLILYIIIFFGGIVGDVFDYSYKTISDIPFLYRLIKGNNFSSLESIIDSLHNQLDSGKNYISELELNEIYNCFTPDNSDLCKFLDSWRRNNKQSMAAYTATAYYYAQCAWNARGGASIKNTPKSNIEKMRSYFNRAQKYLDTTLALDSVNLFAYEILIQKAMACGEPKDEIIKRCMKYFPYSYVLQNRIIYSYTPRWGNDYKQIEKIIQESQEKLGKNPFHKILESIVACDIADMLKDKIKANEIYNDNISKVNYWSNYYNRGLFYYFNLQYNFANDDFDEALKQRPYRTDVLKYNALTKYRLAYRSNYSIKDSLFYEAGKILKLAYSIYPMESSISKLNKTVTQINKLGDKKKRGILGNWYLVKEKQINVPLREFDEKNTPQIRTINIDSAYDYFSSDGRVQYVSTMYHWEGNYFVTVYNGIKYNYNITISDTELTMEEVNGKGDYITKDSFKPWLGSIPPSF